MLAFGVLAGMLPRLRGMRLNIVDVPADESVSTNDSSSDSFTVLALPSAGGVDHAALVLACSPSPSPSRLWLLLTRSVAGGEATKIGIAGPPQRWGALAW